jgi:hypothetical protein
LTGVIIRRADDKHMQKVNHVDTQDEEDHLEVKERASVEANLDVGL